MISDTCLCKNCSRLCDKRLKRKLVLSGKLTYVYLKNGNKVTNTCNLYAPKINIKKAAAGM